jgi:hypothetical protein
MYTYVLKSQAAHGKVFELINLLKEWGAVVKRITGVDITIATTVGGSFSEVGYFWQRESLDAHEAAVAAIFADAEAQAIYAKLLGLVVPNSASIRIYKHQN